jgi:hypothetical protein
VEAFRRVFVVTKEPDYFRFQTKKTRLNNGPYATLRFQNRARKRGAIIHDKGTEIMTLTATTHGISCMANADNGVASTMSVPTPKTTA